MYRLNYSKFQRQSPQTNDNTIKELCLACSDGLIIIRNSFIENSKKLELKFNWFDKISDGESDSDAFEFVKEDSLDNFYLLNIHQLSLQYKQIEPFLIVLNFTNNENLKLEFYTLELEEVFSVSLMSYLEFEDGGEQIVDFSLLSQIDYCYNPYQNSIHLNFSNKALVTLSLNSLKLTQIELFNDQTLVLLGLAQSKKSNQLLFTSNNKVYSLNLKNYNIGEFETGNVREMVILGGGVIGDDGKGEFVGGNLDCMKLTGNELIYNNKPIIALNGTKVKSIFNLNALDKLIIIQSCENSWYCLNLNNFKVIELGELWYFEGIGNGYEFTSLSIKPDNKLTKISKQQIFFGKYQESSNNADDNSNVLVDQLKSKLSNVKEELDKVENKLKVKELLISNQLSLLKFKNWYKLTPLTDSSQPNGDQKPSQNQVNLDLTKLTQSGSTLETPKIYKFQSNLQTSELSISLDAKQAYSTVNGDLIYLVELRNIYKYKIKLSGILGFIDDEEVNLKVELLPNNNSQQPQSQSSVSSSTASIFDLNYNQTQALLLIFTPKSCYHPLHLESNSLLIMINWNKYNSEGTQLEEYQYTSKTLNSPQNYQKLNLNQIPMKWGFDLNFGNVLEKDRLIALLKGLGVFKLVEVKKANNDEQEYWELDSPKGLGYLIIKLIDLSYNFSFKFNNSQQSNYYSKLINKLTN